MPLKKRSNTVTNLRNVRKAEKRDVLNVSILVEKKRVSNAKTEETVPLQPQCPHCHMKFDAWHLAKIHVKYCAAGKPRRRKIGNMPDRSKYFQSGSFLKAKDIKDGQTVTVEEFSEAKTKLGTRPILRLKGIEQPFGLNATNYDRMVDKFGDNDKNWVGKKIRLTIVSAPNPSAGNKMQPAIRIE